eukprot:CAMPEP_0113487580 /NCGR_PEP_ID=MMETSP0014_2-20120614/25580_1 /TAXON_ID=2857 /ORGANISM="Nitzschia sp." /LENGTH=761 /DNA_ID=CAMNT_0000381277 /DNA_START=38 /DNA_END=2319 /DNA_ORIENTATION=+ /assembly_acc=CAM_ASM_000159
MNQPNDDQPQEETEEDTKVMATDTQTEQPGSSHSPTKPTFSWGNPSNVVNGSTTPTAHKHRGDASNTAAKKNLAEIMAEETADRDAALLTNDSSIKMKTLAEIQAEQEKIFMSLQQQQQQPQNDGPKQESTTDVLDEEERRMIELALKASLQDQPHHPSNSLLSGDEVVSSAQDMDTKLSATHLDMDTKLPANELLPVSHSETDHIESNISDGIGGGFSAEEQAAIQTAIEEANAKEEAESLRLALLIQQEEIDHAKSRGHHGSGVARSTTTTVSQGHVRSMTRQELEDENRRLHEAVGLQSGRTLNGAVATWYDEGHLGDPQQLLSGSDVGFRMNAAPTPSGSFLDSNTVPSGWTRRDRNTIVGPNNELRTKHDPYVEGQTNAEFLDLDVDEFGDRIHVSNKAFNSFRQTMKQRSTSKGVASHGTGRAGSDTAGTRGKAMDPNVRLQVDRAINNGLVKSLNGAVKQGKEAVFYHAYGGRNSGSSDTLSQLSNEGFDVAVKVFKRITEFRGRGEYVDGDPRYGTHFRNMSEREQLNLWSEKEFRNLIRASRGGVPVPTPLHYKDNIIFMRFMGQDCWPAPQIREIGIRKGSSKWATLYNQVLESMRRLYTDAKLVHADLSEYNILICPVSQVDNPIASDSDPNPKPDDLQTVLIDFGQAVDIRHPKSNELLIRDATRVRAFFHNQGTKVLSVDEMITFITTKQAPNDDSSPYAKPEDEKVQAISFLLDGRAVQKVKLRRYIESAGRYFNNVGGYVVNTPSG